MAEQKTRLPAVHLTQQDFVSTFPWGLTGDRVRIRMQEVENLLLDAESAAAMAVLLGHASFSDRLDEAWKTYLNAQNHDIHVCSQEKAGLTWCEEADPLARAIRAEAAQHIEKVLGAPVEINALSWSRRDASGQEIPAFGFAPQTEGVQAGAWAPWGGWLRAGAFSARLAADGTIEIEVAPGGERARVGNLTVEIGGKTLDSRDTPPAVEEALADAAGQRARATLRGQIGPIAYTHRILVKPEGIDYETEFDYGETCNFGPDIRDFEAEPRRTHYFQHERKLCMNFRLEEPDAAFLYNSPFLTWPAAADARSVESLHFVALQGKTAGLAHMNVGQCGYARDAAHSSARHVLGFAPHDYIYGKPEQVRLFGKHVHQYRFLPYAGDWRTAGLTKRAMEFQRETFASAGLEDRSFAPASLLQVRANSTIATALFEREGSVYLRLFEWAGQEDTVDLVFGAEDTAFVETTHALEPIGKLDRFIRMRPWEIKTIRLDGKAKLLPAEPEKTSWFVDCPAGWERKNLFEEKMEQLRPPVEDGDLFFVSGYHDGFVRPLERHTPTMEIEMGRTEAYSGYTNAWEIGGSCWVRMAQNEPEYLEALKPCLREGRVEITGGTWCEPFSLIVSGESNIRQMFYGTRALRETLDYQVTIYNNQEHATYAQMPQILRSFGIYAAINRTQWAPYGYESAIDAEVADWIGPDGTHIWVIPRYHSMNYKTCPWDDRNLQNGSVTGHNRVWRTEEKFEQMRKEALAHGVAQPLMTMIEDIWSEGLRTTDEELAFYDSLPKVRFISFARYLERFGITKENN